MKTETKKAGVMTTASNVKYETAPKVDPAPAQKLPVKDAEQPKEEKKLSTSQTAKLISERAKQSDQYEYDDPDEAREIFNKLPEGEFVIKEGNKTVIQKL